MGETDTLADAPKYKTRSYTVDASSVSVVSTANDTITIADHRFVDGDRLNYRDGGGTAIAGLTDEENTLSYLEQMTHSNCLLHQVVVQLI